jgi:hypothetical protein
MLVCGFGLIDGLLGFVECLQYQEIPGFEGIFFETVLNNRTKKKPFGEILPNGFFCFFLSCVGHETDNSKA